MLGEGERERESGVDGRERGVFPWALASGCSMAGGAEEEGKEEGRDWWRMKKRRGDRGDTLLQPWAPSPFVPPSTFSPALLRQFSSDFAAERKQFPRVTSNDGEGERKKEKRPSQPASDREGEREKAAAEDGRALRGGKGVKKERERERNGKKET